MPRQGQESLTISKQVKDALEKKRKELGLRSLPAVIRHLLGMPDPQSAVSSKRRRLLRLE